MLNQGHHVLKYTTIISLNKQKVNATMSQGHISIINAMSRFPYPKMYHSYIPTTNARSMSSYIKMYQGNIKMDMDRSKNFISKTSLGSIWTNMLLILLYHT